MTETLSYRLSTLLGADPRECSALPLEEIEQLLDATIDAARRSEIDKHAEECAECAELLADIASFRRSEAAKGRRSPRSFRQADAQARRALGLSPRSRAVRPRRWLVAAAALLVAAICLPLLVPERGFPISASEAPIVSPPITRGPAPRVAIDRARAAAGAGDLEEARALIDGALKDHPSDAFLLHNQGVLRLRSGDAAGAVQSLSASAAAQGRASDETRFWLAVGLAEQGERDQACLLMREVATLGGGRAEEARALVGRACPAQSGP